MPSWPGPFPCSVRTLTSSHQDSFVPKHHDTYSNLWSLFFVHWFTVHLYFLTFHFSLSLLYRTYALRACRYFQVASEIYRTYAFCLFLSFQRKLESSIEPFFMALDSTFQWNDTNCVGPNIVKSSGLRSPPFHLRIKLRRDAVGKEE